LFIENYFCGGGGEVKELELTIIFSIINFVFSLFVPFIIHIFWLHSTDSLGKMAAAEYKKLFTYPTFPLNSHYDLKERNKKKNKGRKWKEDMYIKCDRMM
jgi:hypothetical protein